MSATDLSLAGLVSEYAEEARTAAATAEYWVLRRNGAIVAWSEAGGSLREIGKAAQLSHQTVANILSRVDRPDS